MSKLKTLKEVKPDIFLGIENYQIITINIIQETENSFDENPNNKEGKRQSTINLSLIQNDIFNLLDVINPKFKEEIYDLKRLFWLIKERIVYIKSLKF